jgi:hypothetical protein
VSSDLAFVDRKKVIATLLRLHDSSSHVLIVGSEGVGKSALLRHVRQFRPILLCEESSSIRRICEGLERQLGWTHREMNVVERKNRLLPYLSRRRQTVALDGVAATPPRVARFIGRLCERVPVWISCRSTQPKELGAVWEYLHRFERLDLAPFSPKQTNTFLGQAATRDRRLELTSTQKMQLHRLAKGNPRVLEELLIELASRDYRLDQSFDRKLLDLDRRIHNAANLASAQLPSTDGEKSI